SSLHDALPIYPRPDRSDGRQRLDGGGQRGEARRAGEGIPFAASAQPGGGGAGRVTDLSWLPLAPPVLPDPEGVVLLPREGEAIRADATTGFAAGGGGHGPGDHCELRDDDGLS